MSFSPRKDGTYLVSRYSGREETVVVPAVYQGASVAGIGMSAFHNQDTIRSILLPDSIEFIGDGAFYSCDALSSITLPSGITSIGENAFEFCTGLTAITIPAAVEFIGDRIISHCDSLVSITVEKGNAVYHSSGNCLIETQSKTLLAGCKSSVIPSDGSVTAIGEDAFAGCLMTDITIPAAITSIGESAFKHCKNLTTIRYLGTRAMWSAIKKGDFWNGGSTPTITLQCTDGSLTIA